MAETKLDQLAEDADFLLAALDPDWLNEHVAKVREFEDALEKSGGRLKGSRTFHPLAISAHNYRAAADAEAALKGMGENFLRLAMTGNALRVLADVPGLDDRIRNLTRGDGTLYYSTEFELASAELYVSRGHTVEFVPETVTPTFDLLVDDTVEVECKQATPVTQEQRQAASLWTLLDRQIRKVLDRHDGAFFVYATVPDLPDQSLIAEILAEVKAWASMDVLSASQTRGNVRYRYARQQPKTKTFKNGKGIEGNPPHWFPDWADHWKIEATAMIDGSGGMSSGKISCLAFDSRKPHPDPGEVIEKRLRKTPRQFTGRRPAVAHADIAGALRRSRLHLSDTEVADRVRLWLQGHDEVTAVNVFAPPFDNPTARVFHLERNPKPAHQLPTPFLGVDWTNLPVGEDDE